MPKLVELPPSGAVKLSPPRKSTPQKSDAGESFKQALADAKPKAAQPTSAPPQRGSQADPPADAAPPQDAEQTSETAPVATEEEPPIVMESESPAKSTKKFEAKDLPILLDANAVIVTVQAVAIVQPQPIANETTVIAEEQSETESTPVDAIIAKTIVQEPQIDPLPQPAQQNAAEETDAPLAVEAALATVEEPLPELTESDAKPGDLPAEDAEVAVEEQPQTVAKQITPQQKKIDPEKPVEEVPAAAPQAKTTPKSKQPIETQAVENVNALQPDAKQNDPQPAKPVSVAHAAPVIDAPVPQQPALHTAVQPVAPAPPPPPETQFADSNHDRIVTAVRSELLPNGGTMHLRLDPPELGSLQVTVHMADGVMTASFETSNDQATKLLSHSLGQLKQVLESQGVSVEKLHVEQTPRDHRSETRDDQPQRQHHQQEGQSARQEADRREMLRRMWRRLRLGRDPLDMVA